MKILGINHIGLAAKDPVKARWFLGEVLALPFAGEELVAEQKTNTVMYMARQLDDGACESRLEILENQAGEEGPIQKFISNRGGGIHHLALAVDNVEEAIAHMKRHGVELIDETPRSGAHQTRIAFIHPRSTGGILVELVQETVQ
ncbi:MAG: methylmalonyl-CoA epimerase [Oligoflexus sp.]